MQTNAVLTDTRVMELAPSVFAHNAKDGLSGKYNFIPTVELLRVLAALGWLPVKAQENKVRNTANQGYQKHMLRFRNFNDSVQETLTVGDSLIELILTNSHNGLASFIFNLGLFRLICSNGMVVAENTFSSAVIRHNSYEAKDVVSVCSDVIQKSPSLISDIEKLRAIELEPEERVAYATAAKTLRFPHPETVDSRAILIPHRSADHGQDLWTTYNVVQENLIKGNVPSITESNGVRHVRNSREIKAIGGSIALNQALWTLTEKMGQIKSQVLV